MLYATKEDLAVWLGHLDANGNPDVSNLPGNVDILLKRASRLIDHATMKRINETDPEHLETAKNAVTAQIEYWIDGVGESVDINPNITSYSAGKTSVEYSQGIPKLSPRSRRELWLGGLFNRAVGRL